MVYIIFICQKKILIRWLLVCPDFMAFSNTLVHRGVNNNPSCDRSVRIFRKPPTSLKRTQPGHLRDCRFRHFSEHMFFDDYYNLRWNYINGIGKLSHPSNPPIPGPNPSMSSWNRLRSALRKFPDRQPESLSGFSTNMLDSGQNSLKTPPITRRSLISAISADLPKIQN